MLFKFPCNLDEYIHFSKYLQIYLQAKILLYLEMAVV